MLSRVLSVITFLWMFAVAFPVLTSGAAEPASMGTVSGTLPAPSPLPTATPPPFVPKEKVSLRINVPATRLDLYVNDQFVRSYKVAIGMPKYPTPIRDFDISYVIWNPWWIPPDSEWALEAEKTPPGPGNPLGPVKLMLGNGMLIHGTNAPGSIGRASSHACMRMKNADAKELAWEIQSRYSEKSDPALLDKYKKFSRSSFWVKLGEEVPVIVEYKQVEKLGDKLLIHPDRYWRGGLEEELQAALAGQSGIVIDKALLKRLNKERRKGTFEVDVTQLKEWCQPPLPPSPPSPLEVSPPIQKM